MADLSVNIGKLNLSNPVMTASGTFGYGLEFQDFVDLEKIGGIIVKGTTLHHREGNPYPRMPKHPWVCSMPWDYRTKACIISWTISIRKLRTSVRT